ncbi:glycosyltransferase [Silanimonas sp.]|uniref:glycosyltransferase n=1 Tax=Silanimonas sp. TaxID=1929290 RepID=UPI0022BE3A4C|nr:glycosyltransferase [Silanimonas sp.]MCZ8115865.1 glycosyltransferase [Silanimonas sp.]
MPSPLVSVALCTCNGEAYIEAQLASVLAQTHRELELVVVDDASNDRTVEIVEEAARRDHRIQLHRNPRRLGVNANFARAFSLCRGDFIAPCDQDDVWSARKLETLMAAIGDADLAYGDSAVVDSTGRPTGNTLGGQRRMVRGRGNVALAFENSVSGHAALFRNTLLTQALPFPEGVWYDGWLAFAASQRAGVVYVDEVMVDFRRHADAQTRIGHASRGGAPDRHQRRAREARQWLAMSVAALDAAATRPWPGREAAQALSRAITDADAGQRLMPLWQALLRHRRALYGDQALASWMALRLGARIVGRMRRARSPA